MPVSGTDWGLPAALSAMDNEPVSVPAKVGLKITEIEQVPATAIEAGQLLVWVKSPNAVILLIVSGAEPELITVTTCAVQLLHAAFTTWLGNVRLAGERVMAAAVIPVPAKETVCGLPVALSVMVIVPVRAPATVGVKITEIVHVLAGATDAPQVFVWLKSPVGAMLAVVSAAEPVLVSVTT